MKGSIGSIFAIIAALLIVGILALLIFTAISGNTASAPRFPQFQNNGTVPSQLSGILSSSNKTANSKISSLVSGHIASHPEFSAAYSGTLYAKPQGLIGSVATIDSPLYVNESKYYNDSKLSIDATGLPVLGTGSILYANLSRQKYLCTNFNTSAVSLGAYEKIFLGSHNVTCASSDSLAGVNFTDLANFNLSGFENDGLQLNYTKVYQSNYRGTPCTYLSGIIPQPQINGTSIGNGQFQMCLSDVYYLPLSFSVYYNNNQATVSITLNNTMLSNYSNASYTQSIPGAN